MAIFDIEATIKVNVRRTIKAPSKAAALLYCDNADWDAQDAEDQDEDVHFRVTKSESEDYELEVGRDGDEKS